MNKSRFVAIGFAAVAIWTFGLVAGCGSSDTNNGSGGGAGGSAGRGGTVGSAGSAGGAAGSASGGQGGGGNDVGTITHCDVTSAGTQTCLEFGTDYTANRAAGCNVLHGTYSAGPCDHASSSGGCKRTVPQNGTQTLYYYPPITTADVMVQCTNDANATYVAP